MRHTLHGFVFGLLVAAAFVPPAAAESASEKGSLKAVERDLDRARKETERLKREGEALGRELRTMRREMVSAAAAVRAREAELTRTEARLSEIERLERDLIARLKLDEGDLTAVLAALARMTRNPPGALLLRPVPPADAVRGAILLRAAAPAIENHAGTLRSDLTELAHARTEAKRRREELTVANIGLETERARLSELFKKKAALKEATDAEQREAERQARALAAKAQTLRDLVVGLERAGAERKRVRLLPPPKKFPDAQSPKDAPKDVSRVPPQPEAADPAGPQRSFARARGLLPQPVIGRISGGFGDKLESGLTRQGIVIVARAGAQVIAPFDGQVVFAGPFRGYGRLLIIEHGEGYHTLLAGMARIDVGAGQKVLAGEPVGVMNDSSGDSPGLYVELRKDSHPINPTPWLQAQKEEVRG